MNPTRKRILLITALAAVAAASLATALALVTRSAHAVPSAARGDRLSPLEAAQIRDGRRGKFSEPAADAVITAHVARSVDGKEWRIVTYRAKSGKLCAGTTWPGEGQAMTCANKAEWFANGPLYVEAGARQDAGHPENWSQLVLSGMVDLNRVHTLELVNTDCSTSTVSLDSEGYFLSVVGSDAIRQGVWPYTLVAHAASGRIVQKAPVEAEAPDTDAARAACVIAPAPSPACA